jgi:TetR/AcrR family transcriptional regulator, cholesterol catabolism regulator
MIHEELRPILDLTRRKALEMNSFDLSFDTLSQIPEFPLSDLKSFVPSTEDLVRLLLEYELEKFTDIVENNDLLDKNAIDAMMHVSVEISRKFNDIFPSLSPQIKLRYPAVYHEQFQKRLMVISEKIRINLGIGMGQGMYRSDLSAELISRLYLSRLIDIHNPDFFPLESFSFDVLFNQMFESLIRSIATPEGLKYFEKQLKINNLQPRSKKKTQQSVLH